jgi:hypothetical protein
MMTEPLSDKLARIGDEAYERRDETIPVDAKVTRGHSRTRTLQVRLNEAEYTAIEAAAEAANLPPSTLVRSLILRQLADVGNPAQVLHAGSGKTAELAAVLATGAQSSVTDASQDESDPVRRIDQVLAELGELRAIVVERIDDFARE